MSSFSPVAKVDDVIRDDPLALHACHNIMNTHELWQAVLGELELSLSKANFTTWFKNTFISSFEGERVAISVPNTFTKAWLEKKYHVTILKSLQTASNSKIREIVYNVDVRPQAKSYGQESMQMVHNGPSAAGVVVKEITHNVARKDGPGEGILNPKYTFENFIVGKGNELAHAAAQAVVEFPGTKYNPLFIYGGVGLGKTHLAQAIGHETVKKTAGAKVMYVTCEKFTNDYINAVKSNRGKEFKDTYRSVDILIIDDIQFIAGKDGTQEEIFHTYNALHQFNKQVILTSDRPPKQIPALEHRLTTRFEAGLMVDISSPDFETRIAILETKCKERNYDLSADIIQFIATVVQSNVRELEGALNKIVAYHQFNNFRPTLESTKSILSSFGSTQSKKNITARHITTTVASYFDVTIPEMSGKCREKRLAFPRQIIMFLMREEMNASYPTIGNELGGRDHTTAMHAYDKIRREVENNPKTRQDIDLIKQRLYNT